MDKISCFIAKDLMPLYVDGVVSEETADSVREHIAQCESCREEYRLLTTDLSMPTSPKVQEENSRVLRIFKNKWKIKKIAIAGVSVLLTLALLFFAVVALREYIFDRSEFFNPKTRVILRNVESAERWQRLTFDEGEYLVFDSVFYEKWVVNDANGSDAEMRVLDKEGNIVIAPFLLEAGRQASLEQLHDNTEYLVEIRAEGQFFRFTFG